MAKTAVRTKVAKATKGTKRAGARPGEAGVKKAQERVRSVLVVLKNRLNFFQSHVYFEIKADDEGTVLKETKLKSAPTKPVYDEVWENDEGRVDLDGCHRFAKKYGHKLLRPKPLTLNPSPHRLGRGN